MEDISYCQHYYQHNSTFLNQVRHYKIQHCDNRNVHHSDYVHRVNHKEQISKCPQMSWLSRLFSFSKLSAQTNSDEPKPETESSYEKQRLSALSSPLEPFAQAYINKETGWERISIIFKKE